MTTEPLPVCVECRQPFNPHSPISHATTQGHMPVIGGRWRMRGLLLEYELDPRAASSTR